MSEGVVKVNYQDVENHSGEYTEAASFLKPRMMNPIDVESTITAKNNALFAYEVSQTILGSLGVGLDNEAEVIRSRGMTFKEYDEMLSDFKAYGYRFPVIVEGDD